MSIANCTRCHKIFKKQFDRKICSECIQEEEDAYRRVVDYLDDHPGSALPAIAAGTDCEEKLILRFIREGRLSLLDKLGDNVHVECKRCGVRIGSGHYCVKCLTEVGDALRGPGSVGSEQADKGSTRTRPAETQEEKRGGDSSRRPESR